MRNKNYLLANHIYTYVYNSNVSYNKVIIVIWQCAYVRCNYSRMRTTVINTLKSVCTRTRELEAAEGKILRK